MSKFEVGFSDVEGTPFRPFRVHAIRMPNGAIYDAVNGWRGDCPPPQEGTELIKEKDWYNKISIEVGSNKDTEGTLRVRVVVLEEEIHSKTRKWPEIVQDYGQVELDKDMEQVTVETDFGTILIARND